MMGSNLVGQLGVSTVGPPAEMQDQLQHMSEAQIDQLYSAGSPILVESLKSLYVEQVSCGSDFTIAIARRNLSVVDENGRARQGKAEVYSWGSNENG